VCEQCVRWDKQVRSKLKIDKGVLINEMRSYIATWMETNGFKTLVSMDRALAGRLTVMAIEHIAARHAHDEMSQVGRQPAILERRS